MNIGGGVDNILEDIVDKVDKWWTASKINFKIMSRKLVKKGLFEKKTDG